jgi:hypothetical protein
MMRKLFVFIPVLLIMLACSLPGGFLPPTATEAPAPSGETITPSLTSEPSLPPPAVAPGLQVAYASGGNIWLWSETTATSTQLTSSGTDSNPVLKSDGLLVAFLRAGEVWVINSDGTEPRAVVNNPFLAGVFDPSEGVAGVQWFSWDPLYNTLYFGTKLIGDPFTMPSYDLWATAIDGVTPPVQIEYPGNGGLITFSPDGQMFTIAQPEKIVLRDREGSIYRDALTYDMVQTYSEWYYIPDVVWFSDSSEFRVVIPAHDPLGDPMEGTYFWSVPVSGTPVDMAGFIAAPAFGDRPRISPDGLNVAYMAPNGTNTDLYIEGYYIGNELYSTYPAGQWGVVGWALDSSRFIYWADNTRTLWIASLGTAAVHLTDTLHSEDIRWVDSTRILFLSDGELRLGTAGGASTLIAAGVDGGYDVSGVTP